MRNNTELDLKAELELAAARAPTILATMREQWTTQIFQQQPARVSPPRGYTFHQDFDRAEIFGMEWAQHVAVMEVRMEGIKARCLMDVWVHQVKAELRESIRREFARLRTEFREANGLPL